MNCTFSQNNKTILKNIEKHLRFQKFIARRGLHLKPEIYEEYK